MRLLFAVAACLFLLTISVFASGQKVLIVTWRGCEEACQGFQDYMKESGIDAEITLRDAARKKEAIPGFLAEARAENTDLIVSWGTSVTLGIAGPITELDSPEFNHEIPQIFMIVADPVGAKVVKSLDETGRQNLTGTYNRVPEAVNIETIRDYLPNFKRLGLLYNTNEQNSVVKRDELQALSEESGFELIALEIPLGEDGNPLVGQIEPKMSELKAKGADFLYLGSSSFIQKNGDAVTAAAVENGIPVLSPYEGLVRNSQALMSVAARYYEVGRLAGQQAERVLKGTTPGDLPVLQMTNFAVVINMDVAKKLQLFPPMDLLQVAETVN
jgi:putative ABC transport system substrate-binding protein